MDGIERAQEAFRYLVTGSFVLLALGAIARWKRVRDPARGAMALALGLLGAVSVIGQVGVRLDYRYSILSDISLVGFMFSGYFLLIFRHAYVPLSRRVRVGALILTAAVSAWTVAAQLPYGKDPVYTSAQSATLLAIISFWALLVGEPIIRFWRVSKGRPAVQRARLRMLSAGYGSIVFILFVAVLTQSNERPVLALSIQISAFLLIGLLQASLAPPAWLRRAWRESEEERLRLSEDLVTFAEDRSVLGQRAVDWAQRLVGADGAFLTDADGVLLACQNFDEGMALSFSEAGAGGELIKRTSDETGESALITPVRTGRGRGVLGVRSGPFSTLFGSDEQSRLARHATLVGVALDRVRATEELRALDQARREFISNASHELRTPLTAILGLASVLETSAGEFRDEQRQEMIEAVHRQARRMRTLVNNLLDLSQLEQGRIPVQFENVALLDCVNEVLEVSPPSPDKAVAVRIDPTVKVSADPIRLEQIFTNLLTNAYRYGGSHIEVSTQADPSGGVAIAVSDNGPGVPTDVLPHLFDPFTRARSATATEGYGLGLAITRGLVRALGGEIRYATPPGGGSRFMFRLRGAV